jgi:phosphomannomutase
VRASGTEDMLRVYSETARAENTERLLNEVRVLVQAL